MSPSTRSLDRTGSQIPNSKIGLKISRLIQKPLRKEADQHIDGITDPSAVRKVIPNSWRDKNRLYPPFRQQRKDVIAQKDDRENEIEEKSVPEPRKYRFSVCIRKKQLPITRANIPLVCNEDALEVRGSDSLYLSSGCGGDNEIPSTSGLHGAPCIEPICRNRDNGPRNITRGAGRADDVCQDAVSAQDDKSDDVSVPSDKLNSHYYMTVCGESIDYVVCGGSGKLTFAAFDNEALHEDLGGEDYFDIHDSEYESSGSTSKHESKSELVSESKLFQDPLVSHRLTIPYKEIPPSRYCSIGQSYNDSMRAKFLTKRSQSPVRDIPEGRFDVHAGIAEVTRRAEIHNAKYALRISKDCMARMITSNSMSSPTTSRSAELPMAFLKVLLDDVRLSLTVDGSENDLSLTLATIWAITEFVMTESGLEVKHSVTIANLGALPKFKGSVSHNLTLLKANSFQLTSGISYPPRGSDSHSLHRALPWVHLCAAHAEGLPKSYVTVRTYIDEVTPVNELKRPRAAYLSDIGCAHFKETPSKIFVLLENKSDEMEPDDHADEDEEMNESTHLR